MSTIQAINEAAQHKRFTLLQWMSTAALITFIAAALYGNLNWSPVLIPSAILTWYGAVRTKHAGRGQE